MMTEEQRLKVAELKAAIVASAPTRGGAPRGVRVAAVALKKELKRAGITGGSLAEALGVHVTTLCRWASESGGEVAVAARAKRGATAAPKREGHAAPKGRGRAARFRRVEVTPAIATPATSTTGVPSSTPATRSLRVAHAPSGLVIDGLDVETLAALLRRMA